MKQSLITGTLCLLAASSSFADNPPSVRYDADRASDRAMVETHPGADHWRGYTANELNVALFATGRVGERTLRRASIDRVKRNGRLGAGVGISYFFCRYVGLEAEAYSDSTSHNFIDNVNAHLIGRLPIGETGLAPYVFGGAGRQLDPRYQWTWDVGAGLEWRFASHVGLFTDARFVWADKTKDYGLGRLGVKFGF